jgi:polyhydroxybutyrate depolymerase
MKTSFSLTFVGLVALAVATSAACSSSVESPAAGTDASIDPGADAGLDTTAPDGAPSPDADPGPDANVADTAPPPPTDDLTAETITVGARTRSFGIRIPKTYDPQVAYPVVFVFHGNGGDGNDLYSFFKFQTGSAEKAILVYPTAENSDWDLYTPPNTNKDIAFVEAMVADVSARYTVDATKIFGWGWSNGAYFVNQVACRRSSLFRAVASHAGGAPYEPSDVNRKWPNGFQQCPGQTAVAFIAFHGTNDPVVGFGGGEFSATYWAYVNGCGPTRAATAPSPCEAYPACSSGKPAVFCPIPSIGHGIWAQAAQTSWDFFQSF